MRCVVVYRVSIMCIRCTYVEQITASWRSKADGFNAIYGIKKYTDQASRYRHQTPLTMTTCSRDADRGMKKYGKE